MREQPSEQIRADTLAHYIFAILAIFFNCILCYFQRKKLDVNLIPFFTMTWSNDRSKGDDPKLEKYSCFIYYRKKSVFRINLAIDHFFAFRIFNIVFKG